MADVGSAIPPPPRPVEYRDVDDQGWFLSLLVGVVLIAVGVWLLTNLFESVAVLALLVGVSLLVGGLVEVAALGGPGGVGWPAWLAGGLLVAAGVAVMVWPDITLWALAVIAGAGLILAGVLRVILALAQRDQPDWPVHLAIGAAGIALGAVVVAWPDATLVVLGVILGVRAVATGLVAIGTAWQIHRLAT
jgi:uncharacterized membrane protein HdeD (DUF308 family)